MQLALLALSATIALAAHSFLVRQGYPRINAVSAWSVPWLTALVLLSIPGMSEPALGLLSIEMAALGIFGISVGAVTVAIIRPVARSAHHLYGLDDVPTSVVKSRHRILVVILALFVTFDMWRQYPVFSSLGGFAGIWSSNGSSFRQQVSILRLDELNSDVNFVQSVTGYLLFLGLGSLITGAILWRRGETLLAGLPLALLAVRSLLTLERTSFVIGAIVFAACVSILNTQDPLRQQRSRRYRRFVPAVSILAVLGAVLLLPLTIRNKGTGNATGVQSLTQYIVSGLAGLNIKNMNGLEWALPYSPVTDVVGTQPGLGSYTFGGWFQIANRLGLSVPPPTGAKDFAMAAWGNAGYATNILTSIGDFYLDFMLPGVFLLPIILASLATWLQWRSISWHYTSLLPASLAVAGLAWGFFGNSVWSDIRYGFVAVLAPLTLGRLRRTPPDSPAVGAASTPSSGAHKFKLRNEALFAPLPSESATAPRRKS